MENRNNTSKGLLDKIRRSISLSPESANEVTQNLTKPKSTFYLTDVIDVDNTTKEDLSSGHDSGFASSPTVNRTSTSNITRPHSPPPPIPVSNTGETFIVILLHHIYFNVSSFQNQKKGKKKKNVLRLGILR